MKLSQFCISRPVFTIVLNVLLVVVGVLSFSRTSLRGYPNINVPVIMVSTNYAGASPSVIESQITTPLENQLAGMSGLDSMHSQSQQGRSKIVLRFNAKVNIDTVADDVRNLVSGRFLHQLPSAAEAPLVSKRDPNAQETLLLALTDNKLSPMALTDYANRYLLPEIQQIYGIADVQIRNARQYAMRINLDPLKMAAHQVTVMDLIDSLQAQNINLSGGQIKTPEQYYNVFSMGQMQSARAFNHMVLRDQDGYLLRLGDVAHASVGAETTDSSMHVDGKTAIGLSVYAESEANPIAVSSAVKKLLHKLNGHLPTGMQLQAIYDDSNFLHAALHSVYEDLIIAILLVVAVVYLFLAQWRAALVPIITIPICVISVFSYIFLAGYSINIFTLLALVLAIGLVVDDAIVMLENIARHCERGMSPIQAAFKGSREIGFAIIAMTITLAAVYAPIGFAQGVTGIIFRQFAFTLAAAVLISGFVALTLSPMMCGRMLQQSGAQTRLATVSQNFFQMLSRCYQGILERILVYRKFVVLAVFLLLVGGGWCYAQLSSSLVPAEDMGMFMVEVSPPANASFAYLERNTQQVAKILRSYPAVEHVVMMSDVERGGFAIVTLAPWKQRHVSASELMHRLMRYTRTHMPEVQVSAFSPGTIGGGGKGGDSIRMSIVSNHSYADIHHQVQRFLKQVLALPSVAQATEDLQLNTLQYNVRVEHNLAASLQVSPLQVAKTIQTMLGGTKTTTFNWQDRDYDVVLQAPAAELKNLDVLNRLYVRSQDKHMVAVGSVAKVKQEVVPGALPHQDRLRADTVQIQLTPGYSMGAVVHKLMKLARHQLPSDYSFRFRGLARDMLQAYGTQLLTFGMAVLVIYLVLCAQFESFIDPLVILLSVPMAIMGAIVSLYVTGHELSIYANIGFVTLIGLIAKHGILITEFANAERRRGLEINEAVVRAATLRLRPILMTTLAMVIGAVPLAMARGANANGLQPIGWVIVGGMLIGTFFSLIVVPVAYSWLAKWRQLKPQAQPQREAD